MKMRYLKLKKCLKVCFQPWFCCSLNIYLPRPRVARQAHTTAGKILVQYDPMQMSNGSAEPGVGLASSDSGLCESARLRRRAPSFVGSYLHAPAAAHLELRFYRETSWRLLFRRLCRSGPLRLYLSWSRTVSPPLSWILTLEVVSLRQRKIPGWRNFWITQ